MRDTLRTLNRMVAEGCLARYAIGGAVAAYNYIEPALTEDLDVLVSFESLPQAARGLVTLGPLLAWLAARGFGEFRKEGVMIGGWAVQFLPVASALDAEALADSQDIVYRSDQADATPVPTRVLRAEHLMATALVVGRPKDHLRIVQFLEAGVFDPGRLRDILDRHALRPQWTALCRRLGVADPTERPAARP